MDTNRAVNLLSPPSALRHNDFVGGRSVQSLLTSLMSRIRCTVCQRLSDLEGSRQNIEQATADRWKGEVPKRVAWEGNNKSSPEILVRYKTLHGT